MLAYSVPHKSAATCTNIEPEPLLQANLQPWQRAYVLADGSKVPSETFRIRSLKVGNKVIENVTGSVADIRGSLLLGQSFLERFKSRSIDNTTHVMVLE